MMHIDVHSRKLYISYCLVNLRVKLYSLVDFRKVL